MKVAVFASGNGSNFEALVKEKYNKIDICLLICDKKNAYVIERAKKYNIKTLVFTLKSYESKEAYEIDILNKLKEEKIDFILLAGYMKIIGHVLLDNYKDKIINIHPSLLPSFKGSNAIKDAYDYGVKVTGVTIHYVNNELDGGKIINQDVVYVKDLSLEDLENEIHKLEHKLYVKTVKDLLD